MLFIAIYFKYRDQLKLSYADKQQIYKAFTSQVF
jgi:hypothetical protein